MINSLKKYTFSKYILRHILIDTISLNYTKSIVISYMHMLQSIMPIMPYIYIHI